MRCRPGVDPSGTVWAMVSTIPADSTSSDTTCPLSEVKRTSVVDAVGGSSTGTSVPWMWALLRLQRFRGANHADDNDNRFRHRQVSFPVSRRRRWRPSGHSPEVEAPLRLGVLPKAVALSGRYRSLRLGAPLVARAPGTGSHRAVDPTGLCEALRQAAEERCG